MEIGYDSSGGRYHCHPFEAPDAHIFTDEEKSMVDLVFIFGQSLKKIRVILKICVPFGFKVFVFFRVNPCLPWLNWF